MPRKIPDLIRLTARELRKNMTEAEKIVWRQLRYDKIGYRFLRQKPIYVFTEDNGHDRFIIADFYCDKKKLILEIDGSIHDNHEIKVLDEQKQKLLFQQGIEILRIKNEEIMENLDLVIQKIKNKLL